MNQGEREGIPTDNPSPEGIPPRNIDFAAVERWLIDLENRTEREDDLEINRFDKLANKIVGYTEEDEKNIWNRNEAHCSCYELPEMPSGCLENIEIEFMDGTKMPAIPFGQETRYGDEPDTEEQESCHDCASLPGHFHHPGCDMEECPRCGLQTLSCDCLNGYVNQEAEDKAFRRDVLSGMFRLRAYHQFRSEQKNAETDLRSAIQSTIWQWWSGEKARKAESEISVENILEELGYFEWLGAEK